MAENGIIYVAFYAELYILISIVLLLKTKVDLCNPAFFLVGIHGFAWVRSSRLWLL